MPRTFAFSSLAFACSLLACGGKTEDNQPPADTGVASDTAVGTDSTPLDTDIPETPPSVDPITAPDETWTWVPITGTQCANGSATGLGVNFTKRSKKAFVFLMGGGACWDALSCGIPLASNLDGYGDAKFASEIKKYGSAGVFDRADADNPFKDYSFFFIPYCTGDVHAGSKSSTYAGKTYQHMGYVNVGFDFARIVPTLKGNGTDYVMLAGSSAGGFGAMWNFPRLQDALGTIHVDLIDDAGPPLRPPYMPTSLQNTWNDSWGLASTVPAGCAKCNPTDGYYNAIDFLSTKYAGHRVSIISSLQDNVIRNYFGLSGPKMQEGLLDFADNVVAKAPDFRYFYVTGSKHTFLGDKLSGVITGTTTLAQFLGKQATGDGTWASVKP